MNILEVKEGKKEYMELLFLADEQEDMINKYLDRGTMFILEDNGVKAECVVSDEGNEVIEIKNIATYPEFQNKGYGKKLIDFVCNKYRDEYSIVQVGTGESPITMGFYRKCGFIPTHRVENFFTDNYDHPIYECGVKLIDMVYLQKKL